MKHLFARLTLPCRRVTRLVSESMDRTLSPITHAKFQAHLFLCEECRLYAAQLRAIRDRLRRASEHRDKTGMSSASVDQTMTRLRRVLKSRRM